MTSNKKSTNQTEIEIEYKKGLPFTVDYQRMVDKTIKNRFHNKNEYLSQLVKLGLLNGKTGVDIKNKHSNISVSFDTDAQISELEFKNIIFDLYGGNKDSLNNTKNAKLQNLGLTIAAALASQPKEIVVEVNSTDNKALRMVIDEKLEPQITVLDKPIKKAKVTVIKDSKPRPMLFAKGTGKILKSDMSDLLSTIIDNISDGYQNVRHGMDFNSRYEILKSSEFAQIDVRLDNKKINRGLSLEDVLYEKEFQLKDGSTAVLSYPKNHFESDSKFANQLQSPRTYFVKDNILISTTNVEGFIPNFTKSLSTPNIIIKSDKFVSSMASNGINEETRDQYIVELESLIETFSNEVFLKISEDPKMDWSKKSRFSSERLEKTGIIASLLSRHNMQGLLENKIEQDENTRKFIETKIIKDTTGKEYSIEEFNSEISKSGTFISTSHPKERKSSYLKNIKLKTPIFITPKMSSRYTSSNTLIDKLIKYQRNINKEFVETSLDNIIRREKSKQDKKIHLQIDNVITKTKTTAKWTFGPLAVGGISFMGTPYVIDAAQYIGNFLFVDNLVETGIVAGITASASGLYKAAPHISNAISTTTSNISSSIKKYLETPETLNEKKEERRITQLDFDDENITNKDILEHLTPEQQKYTRTVVSILQDFNFGESKLISDLIKNKSQLVCKPNNDKGFEKNYGRPQLIIDCYSKEFKKKSEQFNQGDFSIVTNELRRYVQLAQKYAKKNDKNIMSFENQQSSLDTYLLEEMRKFKRNDMVNQYFDETSQFQENFSQISQNEKHNLLKVMLNDSREQDSPFEEWLFQNHEKDIDTVTDRIMAKADYSQLVNMYNNPQLQLVNYSTQIRSKFFNMTSQEKLEVINYVTAQSKSNESTSSNQLRFMKKIIEVAPELAVKRTDYDSNSYYSENVMLLLLKGETGKFIKHDIKSLIDNYYEEPLYRKTLRSITDFIPEKQQQINQILY